MGPEMGDGYAKIIMKLSSWGWARELRGWGSVLSYERLVTGDLLSWSGSRFWAGSRTSGTTSILSLASLPLSPHHS